MEATESQYIGIPSRGALIIEAFTSAIHDSNNMPHFIHKASIDIGAAVNTGIAVATDALACRQCLLAHPLE